MTATLLLIRHAAHGHLDRILSGRMPGVPLSADGEAQAAALAERLAGEAIDRIECSPLERAQATAAAIARQRGAPDPVTCDALIELDMGEWTGRSFATLRGDPAWQRWNAERGTAQVPGGETMGQAQDRIWAHLSALAAGEPGRTIALVTHSDMIRAAVARVLGLPLGEIHRFDVDPASVTRIVAGDWGARLMTLNEPTG